MGDQGEPGLRRELAALLEAEVEWIRDRWLAEVMALPGWAARRDAVPPERHAADLARFLPLLLEHIREPTRWAHHTLLDETTNRLLSAGFSVADVIRGQVVLKKLGVQLLEERGRLSALGDLLEEVIDENRLRMASPFGQGPARRGADGVDAARQLAALGEITAAINSSLDINEVLKTIAEGAARLARFDELSVALLEDDEEHAQLFVLASPERDPGERRVRIRCREHPLGLVMANREPVIARDLPEDERLQAYRPGLGDWIRSFLCIPMVSKDHLVGSLNLAGRRAGEYTQSDCNLLQHVAGQIAIAIENAHLFDSERRRARHMAMLCETGRRLIAPLDRSQLLRQAAEGIQRNFEYYDVSIFLVDHEQQEMQLAAQAGEYSDVPALGYTQKIGVGLVGACAEAGQTIVVNDVRDDPRYVMAFPGEADSMSEMTIPVKADGRTVGVINVECQHLEAFDEMDRIAMEALADQLGRALERVDLFGEVQRLKNFSESIVTDVPCSLVVLDSEQRILSVNNACSVDRGVAREELVGRRLSDAFPVELLDELDIPDVLDRVITTGEPEFSPDVEERTPSGERKVFNVRIARVGGDHERRVLMVMDDITEERQAEHELKREAQKLERVVHALNAGLALLDPDLRIVWANRTLKDWFGIDEQALGQPCHRYYRASEAPCDVCPARQALESGRDEGAVQFHFMPDGQRQHFQHLVVPIKDAKGKTLQLLKLTQDVTAPVKKAEQLEVLRRLSDLMQGTLDLDPLLHSILTFVTAGHALGFNRALLLMVNRQTNTLEGKIWVGPADQEDAHRIWGELSEQDTTLEELLELHRSATTRPASPLDQRAQQLKIPLSPEGGIPALCILEEQPLLVGDARADARVAAPFREFLGANQFVAVPLVARGKVIGAIIADNLYSGTPIAPEDVSMLSLFAGQAALAIVNAEAFERLEHRMQLLTDAYGKLEDAGERVVRSERLATIGRMAAHVAHEIRNPLATIGGFARSIANPKLDETRRQRNAGIIVEEVERLEEILSNVMDFTKPAQPILEERNLNDVVHNTCQFFEQQLAKAGVTLDLELADELPDLWIDPSHIRQVLLNLMQNAVSAMPEGGRLDLRTRTRDTVVELEVTDSGVGIPAEHLPDIFDPFFTTKEQGTGLGLATSQKIIMEHGGTIEVSSEEQAGTRFVIALPIDRHDHHVLDSIFGGGRPEG